MENMSAKEGYGKGITELHLMVVAERKTFYTTSCDRYIEIVKVTIELKLKEVSWDSFFPTNDLRIEVMECLMNKKALVSS